MIAQHTETLMREVTKIARRRGYGQSYSFEVSFDPWPESGELPHWEANLVGWTVPGSHQGLGNGRYPIVDTYGDTLQEALECLILAARKLRRRTPPRPGSA